MSAAEIRCPACGGKDVTFDWLYVVVSARFKGGELESVSAAGFSEVAPEVVGTCDSCGAEGIAVPRALGHQVADVVEASRPDTRHGFSLYERSGR